MNRFQSNLIFSALLFWSVLTVSGATAQSGTPAPTSCPHAAKIGVVLPLSSGPVLYGEALRNSIILASERFDPHQCVRFIFEDDQFVPKNTVSAVNKLMEVDQVNALVVFGTPTALAVVDIVESRRLPTVAVTIVDKAVAGRGYVVKHWCTAERLDEAVKHEVKRRGYNNVAIVSTLNDAMLRLRDLYVATEAATVVMNEELAKDDLDYRSLVARIKQKNPAAVYVLLYPAPQTSVFVKALRGIGYKGDLFGVHNVEDPNEVKASGNTMIGMWYANEDDSAGESYKSSYRARFGSDAPLGGANGFDIAKMIIEAVVSGQEINHYLHEVKDFSGAFGKYSATGKNDFDIPVVVKTVKEQGFVAIAP